MNSKKHIRYNWSIIQNDYDIGLSQPDIIKKYGMSTSTLYEAIKKGKLKSRSCIDARKLAKLQGKFTGKAHTPEKELQRISKLSMVMKHHGGYRRGSGRGKQGLYKGIYCDSSWELAYVIYCFDKGISIKRNTQKFKYTFNGIERNYIPDFVINTADIIEIKGYKTKEWEAKLKFNKFVIVLYHEEMKPIISYVQYTYGKDFIKLYE